MRIASRFRIFPVLALFSLLLTPLGAGAAVPLKEAAALLPDRIGDFRAQGPAREAQDIGPEYLVRGDGVISAAMRYYILPGGHKYSVLMVKTSSDAAAYALVTSMSSFESKDMEPIKLGDIGTASVSREEISFFKGSTFVKVMGPGVSDNYEKGKAIGRSLAQALAETLDKGEGEIPVLVKHLPGWDRGAGLGLYAVGPESLRRAIGSNPQPVLDAVSFEGGAEAVCTRSNAGDLVIIEHMTPQIASDTDARIQARIKELQAAGQPVPSAYRRVGNYSVFVFNAPDERAAAQLIDQVSYEQVVQWLGTNPHLLERAQREYVNTMGGTILAVLKASGLSLIVCFGLGGLVGAWVFKRRRAQAAAVSAYSDAGGMLRLNIDELSAQTDSSRLLGRGES